MELIVDGEVASQTPDDAAVRRSLETQQEFVNLARSEMDYIQAGGSSLEDFVLEYQEGDLEHHYRCIDPLSLEKITEALLWYLHSDDRWRTNLGWERMVL